MTPHELTALWEKERLAFLFGNLVFLMCFNWGQAWGLGLLLLPLRTIRFQRISFWISHDLSRAAQVGCDACHKDGSASACTA